MLLSLFTGLLLTVAATAQQPKSRLAIQLDKSILQPGDSLLVTVAYTDTTNLPESLSLATLELLIENEQGLRTRLRWPVVDGQASGTLYLPDSLPKGRYTLLAGLQQRFFEVTGKLQNPGNNDRVQAMLLTKTGAWDEQEVPVQPDGSFAIRNWLFEDNALLAFSGTNNQPLNIRISTQLDSSYTPLAVGGRAFYIGEPPATERQKLNQPVDVSEALFSDQGSVLPAVVVRSTTKSRAQQFNEEYATGLFQSANERLINVLDDPSAQASPNLFTYLQGRVAGLQITPAGFGGGAALWRNGPVSFFMDEMRVSAQQIANIPMTDIAIVKPIHRPLWAVLEGVPPLPCTPAAVAKLPIFLLTGRCLR
ncbi:MAG: hypothetical protein EOO14_22170 [Chitinophagaceae bacterium]|nr:MAG: hypothetical protein EOO14_22170 [Chitinophagaceae bacterium]